MALLDGPFEIGPRERSTTPVPEDRQAWTIHDYPDYLKGAGPEYTSLDMSGDFV